MATQKYTRDELIRRGEHAQALINDPLIAEAFGVLESEILRVWRTTDAGDVHSRERAWLALQLSDRFKGVFYGILGSGQIAAKEVSEFLKPVDARPVSPS